MRSTNIVPFQVVLIAFTMPNLQHLGGREVHIGQSYFPPLLRFAYPWWYAVGRTCWMDARETTFNVLGLN
jgi:hypothetical protein